MFKNILKVTIQDNSILEKLHFDHSWEDKDILFKLLNDYVPNHVTDIIPLDNNQFEITWKEKNLFIQLLNDKRYVLIKQKFNDYGVNFIW